jgi:DNA-binding CsgD family transcriptional regulator
MGATAHRSGTAKAASSAVNPKRPFPDQLGLALDLPLDYYDLLHHEQRGVVLHWERQAPDKRWTKLKPNDPRIPEILRLDREREDRFISVNEFDGWRYIRLLRSLRALYVDLDDQTDLYAVLDFLSDHRVPHPGLVVFSGTGMHLYWLLEPLPPKALPVWQRLQDALIRLLKPLGADPVAKDCTRVLRIVGTRNRGEMVRALILDGHRWPLRQIAFEILGTEGRGRKPEVRDIRARRQSADRAIRGSIYERWHLVYRDLLRISEHHGHRIPEGHRDTWLFLTGVALSWFTHPQGIEAEILGLGRDHTDLDEREIRQALEPSLKRALLAAEGHKLSWNGQQVDPRYRFRRQTLYDWIGGLIPAALLPLMRAIIPDEEARRRDKARDRVKEGRYRTRYTQSGVRACNEQKRETARLMRDMGKSYREIAAELDISHPTAIRWCR